MKKIVGAAAIGQSSCWMVSGPNPVIEMIRIHQYGLELI